MRPRTTTIAAPTLMVGLVLAILATNASHLLADEPPDFAHETAPLLKKYCGQCHLGGKSEGGLSLNTREQIVASGILEPQDSAAPALIARLTSSDPEFRMPPADQPQLSSIERDALLRWIEADLPWDEGVTLAPSTYEPPLAPRRPDLPPAVEGRDNPIDRIVDAYYASRQVTRPRAIGDAEFFRRASLDLIGLLPAPEALAAFLQDASADKRARKIDELLGEREAYATHWLTFWNDLLRNAYSGTGFIDDGRRQITGWLYKSLYDNKRYDHFARELIAPTPESEGFVRGIKWRGNVNASQITEMQFAQSVGQVFLGINIKCASCHDSFIDRWKLDDAYGLAAIYATEPLQVHRCDIPQGRTAEPTWIFPELGSIDAAAPQPERLAQLAKLMTSDANGRFARTMVNRLWHRLMGRGIVHPVDAMQSEPWSADLLDYLAVYFTESGYDVQAVVRLIAASHAYQSTVVPLEQRPADDGFVFRGPLAKRMTAEQLLDALATITHSRPQPDEGAFKEDGRRQRGELAAILSALEISLPGEPPELIAAFATPSPPLHLRAALLPQDSLQRSLGRPGREQTVSSRPNELATLEAMALANGPALASMLEQGAAKLVEKSSEVDPLISALFLSALAREATPAERGEAREILGATCDAERTADLLWCVMMLPEFQLIR